MRECDTCHQDWPLDRFREAGTTCFRCRASSLQFNYGPRGKSQFHDVTVKEFNDRQIAEARANGADPVPVKTATTAVPTQGLMTKLETALKSKDKPNGNQV